MGPRLGESHILMAEKRGILPFVATQIGFAETYACDQQAPSTVASSAQGRVAGSAAPHRVSWRLAVARPSQGVR